MKRRRNHWALFPLLSGTGLLIGSRASADVVAEFAPVEEAHAPAPRGEERPQPTSSPSPALEASLPRRGESAPATAAPPGVVPPAAVGPASTGAPTLDRVGRAPAGEELSEVESSPRPFVTTSTNEGVRDTLASRELTDEERHYVSLSFSAARAFASLYEITAEVALGKHIGLAALVGLGGLDVKHPSYAQRVRLEGRELGAQARVYVLGDFDHGLMLGGEVLRVWAEAKPTRVTDPDVVTVNGTRYSGTATLEGEGTLTGVGAFIGYKLIAGFGLTFDAKLGWQRLTVSGNGTVMGQTVVAGQTVQQSESGSIHESQDVPLFNLNLGWSI